MVGPPGQDPPAPELAPGRRIDVRAVRHPAESSRFALAVVAAVSALVVLGTLVAALGQLATYVGWVVGLLVGAWITGQLYRARLVADAVRVSSATLPELQGAVDEVRELLDYHDRLDVYVRADQSATAELTGYFGIRVLLLKGEAVADLTSGERRPELLFLLGTYVGALKARQERWTPVTLLVEHLGLQRLLAPLVRPWYRATVYTGDRIGYLCARDLGLSLEVVVHRALIGREMAPQLRPGGVLAQATLVRRSWVLRSSQLLRASPHVTNRLIELLHWVQQVEPEAVDRYRARLDARAAALLADVEREAARSVVGTAGVAVTAVLTVAAAVALASTADDMRLSSDAGTSGSSAAVVPDGQPEGDPEQPLPTARETREESPSEHAGEPMAEVASAASGQPCEETTTSGGWGAGVVSSARCELPGGPVVVELVDYGHEAILGAAVEELLGADRQDAPCGDVWETIWWAEGSVWCAVDSEGGAALVWTYEHDGLLGVVSTPDVDEWRVHEWFTTSGVPEAVDSSHTSAYESPGSADDIEQLRRAYALRTDEG